MATLVATGQFSIIDTNDSRTVTASLNSGGIYQQVYSKDNGAALFTPNWASANLVITPSISISGLSQAQVWAGLTNRKFSGSANRTALGTGLAGTMFVDGSGVVDTVGIFAQANMTNGGTVPSTFTLKANLADSTLNYPLYFDADFTDPATGQSLHITCNLALSILKTGSNAVYITTRGSNQIVQSTTSVKNVIAIAVDLVRPSGIDTDNLVYKWFDAVSGTQLTASVPSYGSLFGLKSVAAPAVPTATVADLGIPAVLTAATASTLNTIVFSEPVIPVGGILSYRVEITDTVEAKTYIQYLTVSDASDPYQVSISSSAGDKLQNGVGSTLLTPIVYSGASLVTPLTGWSFTWMFFDRSGVRGSFVDTAKIATAGGALISANTATTISFANGAYVFLAGDIVKAVSAAGIASFYEVASYTTGIVTLKPAPVASVGWLTTFTAPVAGALANGKLFGCVNAGFVTTTGANALPLDGDEVDVKANIICQANRP
jgi:hypothetical protein